MTSLRLFFFSLAIAAALVGYASNNLLALIAAALLLALVFVGVSETTSEARTQSLPLSFGLLIRVLRTHAAFVLGASALLMSATATWISLRDEFSVVANVLWLCALPLMLIAALSHDGITLSVWRAHIASLRRRTGALEVVAIGAITLIAFVLRAYDLAHFPPSMHGDEGEMGMLALRVLDGKEPLALFGTYWLDHPSLFHYVQAIALSWFGRDEIGLRMLSVMFGTLCVPLTFAIARIGWGRLAAFSAAWLLTVSALHIHFSRIGLNNIESVCCMILVVLLLALLYERGARRLVVATQDATHSSHAHALLLPVLVGLVIGFSQYLYYGSRLIPVVAAPLLFYLWHARAINMRQVAVMLLALVVAFLPLGVFYLNHPPAFTNRMSGVSILREQNVKQTLGPEAQLPNDTLRLLQVQLERNLNFFVRGGDASSFYLQDVSAFDALTSLLFWLGLGVALTRARRYHEFALLVWFALGVFLAGVMTNDAPNAPRLIVMVPSVYLLATLFVTRAARFFRFNLGVRRRWLLAPALVGAAFVLLVNGQMYFDDYARKSANLAPIMVAREMMQHPQQEVYLLGEPNLYVEHGVIRFVARGVRAHNLKSSADLAASNDEGILLIALINHVDDLQAIAARVPGGSFTSEIDPLGRLIYVAYRVPPRNGY